MSRLLVVALASSALVGLASAEHEVPFRFTVLGYVSDAQGRPVAGRPVGLVRLRTGFSYVGETDAQGFYVIVARLGDESAGERLRLTIGGVSVVLSARFDPANRVDERGTRVDLNGNRFVERAAWFPSTLRKFLGSN